MTDWLNFIDKIEQTCSQYCLLWWETVGIWFTGLATFAVVIVSLALARRDRPKVKISAGIRMIVGGEATDALENGYPRFVAIALRNIGNRPIKIEGLGWHKLRPFNLHAYQTIPPQISGLTLPAIVPDGDSITAYVSLDDPELAWAPEFAQHFVGRWPTLSAKFIRVTAWTPAGHTFRGRLEKPLRELLVSEWLAAQA